MPEHTTFRRVDGVAEATVDTETILMAPTDGRCHALRGPAVAIWELLKEPRTQDQVTGALTERFAVEPTTCAQDVASALSQFVHAGLVTVSAD